MDLHLKDKVFIVTGGAKGIGKAICMQLLEEGAVPVVLDKDESAGSEFAQKYKRAQFIGIDLGDVAACQRAVEDTHKRFGHIDGLVNNAGFNDGVGLEKGDPKRFVQSLTSNAGHFYFLAHHALPHLKKSKGSIVNIASKVAITGQGNTSGYAAAKGAILAMTREWAVELLPYSIRVNAILPAEVWTPLYEKWISSFENPGEKKKEIEQTIPLEHRMTTPEEIANMVVVLLSDRSSHITGQWLSVDGGYVHLDRAIGH
jgi:L-fucose dehydrogenase